MKEKLRIALIGFGGMGQLYAKMIFGGMVESMVLTGVCCRNAAGQKVLAEEFPGVAVYADTDGMEALEADFDAVIIVTPHTSHIPIAMRIAKLGKHILLDKPAGIDAGEVDMLVRECESRNLAFGMIFNNRQLPAFKAVKDYLDSGKLGKLHRAVWVCNSWYRSPAYHASAGWRSSWNGECGGLMINQNPHYLDLWNWFFGMPDQVYASMEFGRYNPFLVDDGVDIQFFYENGFHGTFVSATGEAPGVNRLEIWGTKGRLTLEGNKLTFAENEIDLEKFGKTNREKFAQVPFKVHEVAFDQQVNPYGGVFWNFADHILHGTILSADGTDGLRQVQLANAVYVSGWEEKKISVPVDNERYLTGLKARQEMEHDIK